MNPTSSVTARRGPGRTRSVQRYIQAGATRAIGLVALALTGLFSLLEFVEQLASVGEGNYTVVNALTYVLLTAPSRLLQVLPVSMLLGCLLSLGNLARSSELTAMLSLGISERRIIGSVLWLIVPIVISLMLLMEFGIPPAQQLALEQRASALSSSPTRHADSFWAQRDRQYLNVQRFAPGDIPIGIDIYSFRIDGGMDTIIHAATAVIRPDGTWLLTDVARKSVRAMQIKTEHFATLSWHSFVSPRQIRFLMLPPGSLPPIDLYRHIRDLPPDQTATRYEQELWAQLTLPLSLIAMTIAAVPFIFGSHRDRNSGRDFASGVGVGVVFSLAEEISGRLGLLTGLSAAVAAITPAMLTIVISIYLFRRSHRSRRRRDEVSLSPPGV